MIKFTQGDNAVLNLTAQDGNGNPITLTGASFQTLLQGASGAIVSFPNSQHTANPDQVNKTGQFTLTLSVTDTQSVAFGTNKEILTIITIGGSQVYYHGFSTLTVLQPVPNR